MELQIDMQELRRFIADRDLLGPPFAQAFSDTLTELAEARQPIQLSELEASLDFWDPRTIKKWEVLLDPFCRHDKLEVAATTLAILKKARSDMLKPPSDDDDSCLAAPNWHWPALPFQDEVLFARSRRTELGYTSDATRHYLTDGMIHLEPVDMPENDLAMQKTAKRLVDSVLFDLKLEATPAQIAMLKVAMRSVKASRSSKTVAKVDSDSEESPCLCPADLIGSPRSTSPPLFSRPPAPAVSSSPVYGMSTLLEATLVPDSPVTSPTDSRWAMREWNRAEGILSLPSSPLIPPLPKVPIWSSPLPNGLLLDSSQTDALRDLPLLPRDPAAIDESEDDGHIVLSPYTMVDEEEIDELASDEDSPLKRTVTPLQRDLDTIFSVLRPCSDSSDPAPPLESSLLSGRIEPPRLTCPTSPPSHAPSPIRFRHFVSDTSNSPLRLSKASGAVGLSVELPWKLSDSRTTMYAEPEPAVVEYTEAQATMVESLLAVPIDEDDDGLDISNDVVHLLLCSLRDDEDADSCIRRAPAPAPKHDAVSYLADQSNLAIEVKSPPDGNPLADTTGTLDAVLNRHYPSPPPSSPYDRRTRSAPARLIDDGAAAVHTTQHDVTSSSDFVYPAYSPSIEANESTTSDRDEVAECAAGHVVDDDHDESAPAQEHEQTISQDEEELRMTRTRHNDTSTSLLGKQVPHIRDTSSPERIGNETQPTVAAAPWNSAEALSTFLASRGQTVEVKRASGLHNNSSAPAQAVSQPERLPCLSPPPGAVPFLRPTWLDDGLDLSTSSPTAPHQVIAFPSFLQKREHYRGLLSAGIGVVERTSRFKSSPLTVLEPHLILDCQTCVFFHPLHKIVGNVYRRSELEPSPPPPTRPEALLTTLARLSTRYRRLIVVLEESSKSLSQTQRLRPYPYTPPVLMALRQLFDNLEKCSSEVEVVLSKGPQQSIHIVQRAGGHVHRTTGIARLPLPADASADETVLLQSEDINEMMAARILESCSLQEFLALSDRKRSEFLNRVRSGSSEPSSPPSFADVEAAAVEEMPPDARFDELFDWESYDEI